jgi:hypothetical protein
VTRRVLDWPARRPRLTIAAIGLVLLAAYVAGVVAFRKPSGRIVIGDAVHYYVYLRSAVFDGDFHFRNDYMRLYGLTAVTPGTDWLDAPTATGHVRNMMSVGPALAWTPGFLLMTGGVALAGALGGDYPLDGFGRWFQVTAGLSGVIAAAIGVWLSFKLCADVYGARSSVWAVLLIWFGSSAVYYSAISPTYSHAVSMLAVSGFFLYWSRTRETATLSRDARVGALAGLVALVRWQDAVFLIVPFVEVVMETWPGLSAANLRRATARLAVCAAGALAAFSPQIVTWMILYGQPVAMPQGEEWMQWGSPRVIEVLFSVRHGLISWTPVCGLALVGLWPLYRKDRVLGAACIAAFAVSLYANAAVIEWWAGEAYGLRRFVSCFPIFALGAAALIDRWSGRPALVVSAFALIVAANFVLLAHYQAFMHGIRTNLPYPEHVLSSPLHLLRWLQSL